MAISRWPYRVREPKDPGDTLDYQFDWSDWLEEGETIVASGWGVTSGEVTEDEFTGTTTRAWLSGGTDRTELTLTNTITTSSEPVARVVDRSLIIRVESR